MTKTGWNRVKNTRVVVSLVTFSIITTLFLDAWHLLPASIHRYLTAIEIIPVLMQVLLSPGTVAVAGFVSVILLTLLFGRIYCSTLCPLGVLQDMIIRLSKKVNKRKRFAFYKPMYWLQYAVFGLGILAALGGGSMIVGDLLEPFSNYGRLISVTLLPAVVAANNGTAALLGRFAIYSLPNIPYHFAGIWLLLSSVIFFAILLFLSVTEGRLFCNSFCPAGALLSLISRFSIFTLKINEDNCNECGACDRVCKSECVDSANHRIEFSACVSCFNCLRSCPKEGGIKYALRFPTRSLHGSESFNSGRRQLLRNVTLPAAALLVAPGIAVTGRRSARGRLPISPPGSVGLNHFTNICTACQLCVTTCPTSVLQPSFIEYGMTGMFQPRMDYSINYCNYECKVCGDICPTGAISRLTIKEKKLVQIGKSKFNKNDCVVVSKKKDCAACSEHCPTKAVHTVPYESGLLLPEIDESLCIGCGACEYACPVTPNKAIQVNSNAVHQVAKPPLKKQTAQPPQVQPSDFPF